MTISWRGKRVQTLDDLVRPGLRAVCVGINPAPPSVAAGHYYQGRLGQQFFQRLRQAPVLPSGAMRGQEDDAAFASGVGFTDIVKRPTARADAIDHEEFVYGKALLVGKLEAIRPPLVIFPFKKTATVLFGQFEGNGFIGRSPVEGVEAFVMPGPYAPSDLVSQRVADLRRWWQHQFPSASRSS